MADTRLIGLVKRGRVLVIQAPEKRCEVTCERVAVRLSASRLHHLSCVGFCASYLLPHACMERQVV